MAMPTDICIVNTMIGFPADDFKKSINQNTKE